MAKFKITDNQTGKTVIISGDSPPTEGELEGIFSQAGLREDPMMTATKVVSSPPSGIGEQFIDNVAKPAAQFMLPNVIEHTQNRLQDIGARGISSQMPTLQETGASALGPLGQFLFGSERQKQGVKAGFDAANTLALTNLAAKAGQGVVTGVTSLAKNVAGAKSLNPFKIAGYARDQAVSKTPMVKTDQLVKAGDNFVKQNPMAREAWETFKPTISKSMETKDLLSRMSKVFGQAYTRSGDVRATAEAGLMNQLYQAGKQVIAKQAPEVAKQTANFRLLYEAPKVAQKIGTLGAKAGLIRLLFGQ